MEKKVMNCIMLDLYGDFLTERQREIADLYYNEDMSLSEIAQQYAITRQGVRDVIHRAERTLNEMEDKLALAKRELTLRSAVAECSRLLDEGRTEDLGGKLQALQEYLLQ